MSYTLFDRDSKIVNPKDLQNRAIWYKHGISKEQVFVERFGIKFGIAINPNKRTDPTAPDLTYRGDLADLKVQETPFFLADRYGIPATYAVTFNLKDALNYGHFGRNYPNFTIFYWIDWVALRMEMYGNVYAAKPLTGIWRVGFDQLDAIRLTSPMHWYIRRGRHAEQNTHEREILAQFEPRLREGANVWAIRGKQANAACSYIFDLRKFERAA